MSPRWRPIRSAEHLVSCSIAINAYLLLIILMNGTGVWNVVQRSGMGKNKPTQAYWQSRHIYGICDNRDFDLPQAI